MSKKARLRRASAARPPALRITKNSVGGRKGGLVGGVDRGWRGEARGGR